jgi:hypothetical protein
MKTAFKIVLGFLIAATLGLVAFTVATAVQVSPEKPEMQKLFDLSLDLTFYWGYALFATALVAAIVAFLFNIISHPSGLVKTLLGLVLAGVVVGVPVGFVLSHDILPVPNSAGGVFDNPFELSIAEIGLYVTYLVAAIAVLVVVFDLLSGLVRKIIK